MRGCSICYSLDVIKEFPEAQLAPAVMGVIVRYDGDGSWRMETPNLGNLCPSHHTHVINLLRTMPAPEQAKASESGGMEAASVPDPPTEPLINDPEVGAD